MKKQIALAALATCVSFGAFAQGSLSSISFALPQALDGFGSGPVPQFNPTNGQLTSVSLTFEGNGPAAVEVISIIASQQLYFWFCGLGTFYISFPGSSFAGSTSCSMSTNSGYIAAGSEMSELSWGDFNLVTNTSQAADLNFFTGTNSVTVNISSGFSINCLNYWEPGGNHPLLDYLDGGFFMFGEVAALTYYYAPPPIPKIGLTYGSYAVLPTFSNLIVGTNYQLQVSTNLTGTFSNYGSAFAATNCSMVYTQYFDVANGSQLFLRLKTSP